MPSLTDIDAQRAIDETISEHEERISELEERISELEERISQVKTAVLALRTRRNTHSAISKLPPELLGSIFVHAKSYTYRRWLNVSPVCRQWRAIVLDTPRMWNGINLSWEVQNALEILKRSKSVPLQVCRSRGYRKENFGAVARAVMCNMERIQELHASVSEYDYFTVQQFLELNPSGSAPLLETLGLWSSPECTLPRGVFWQDMPALRVLALGCTLVDQLPMLPRLSRLDLHHTRPALSSYWLLQALLNTPLLEELLVYKLLADLGTDMPTPPRVSLPKLTSLRISTDHVLSSKAFDYIDYPCSSIVYFSVSSGSERHPDISCLQSICVASGDGPTLSDSVEIDFDYFNFEVKVYPSRSGAESPPEPRLTISVSTSVDVIPFVQLCRTLPLATARTLSLTVTFRESDPEWLTLFRLCRQVTTLRLSGWDTSTGILGLLSTDDDPTPPLETLETIVIYRCQFHARDGEVVDAVTDLLKERQGLSIAIRELRLDHCEISKDVIDVFKGLVEVHADGCESRGGRNCHSVRDVDEESDGPEESAEEVSDQ